MKRIVLYQTVALVAAQSAGFGPNTGQAGGFQPHNPVVFAKPFPVTEQQWEARAPQRVQIAVDAQGFFGQQLDSQFKKPFSATEQQFQARPDGRPPSQVDVQGFLGRQYDYRFAKPFPVAAQQYSAFQPSGVIVSTTPQGFFGYQWDARFAKQFPVGEQQFLTLSPQRLTSLNPTAFLQQDPVVFKKLFPVTEQPFTTAPEPEEFLPGFGWWGWQLDYKFAKPFPAALQQFAYYQVQGEVPEFHPPGAGKYPKIPSYVPQPAYDVKPAKKQTFRPVWDKGPAPVEAPLPPRPVPLPPASIFQAPPAPLPPIGAPGSAPPFGLPDFNNLVPHDPVGTGKRLQEAQDMTDALAVLKKLGLIG